MYSSIDLPGRPDRLQEAVLEPRDLVAEVAHGASRVGDDDDGAAGPRGSSANFSLHLRWNASSPTASTSSTSRMSGSTLIATEKPSRTYMPDE